MSMASPHTTGKSWERQARIEVNSKTEGDPKIKERFRVTFSFNTASCHSCAGLPGLPGNFRIGTAGKILAGHAPARAENRERKFFKQDGTIHKFIHIAI